MRKHVDSIVKFFFSLAIVISFVLIVSNKEYIIPDNRDLIFYLFGGVIYAVIFILLLQKRFSFYETLLHEITHFLFAIITFKKVKVLHIASNNGVFQYEGRKDFLVALSPYFFPMLTILVIIINVIATSSTNIIVNVLVVITFSSFICRLVKDFSFNQPDISESGKLFSLYFIVSINIIFLIFLMHYLSGDSESFALLFRTKTVLKLFQ